MIRSSAHSLKFTNQSKRDNIREFLAEYRRLLQAIIDDIWESGIEGFAFDVSRNDLYCPSFLPNDYLKTFDSWFTARMKQCVGKQACSMIRAAVTKRRKQLYVLRKLQQEGKDCRKLQSKIDRQPLIRPDAHNAKVELDPRFVDFQPGKEFDLFVRVKTVGNGMVLKVPIRETKPSRKWLARGARKRSIRLSEDTLWFIYDVPNTPKKQGRIVGCDQGYKTVATLSDGQATKSCPHGHALETIQAKLAGRKKGSKGFRRAQEHRKNYINWSLNQINWSNIGKVRFEKVKYLRYKKRSSRQLSHWVYTVIRKKVVALSETEGFEFEEASNAFRSQRCSQCGWVCRVSRKGQTFQCGLCGFTENADRNAAANLELDLYEIPWWVQQQKLNREGFYWESDGLYSVGHEPIVRDAQRATA